ncbi:MAG: hydrolase TatD [Planctomycetota bacterium]|nr:MAG: hydrolase TatD [Planctomycetota bacterium]
MWVVETHCHLDFPQFEGDLEAVLKHAREAGVLYMVTIGTSLESSRRAVELAYRYENVYATVGVHPHDAEKVNEATLTELEELGRNEKVVAVGEVGLDFYRNLSPRQIQERVFREFINLAKRLNKPLVLHTRDATKEVLKILEEEGAPQKRGVFHCWASSVKNAKRAVELGFHISFAGNITFKNAEQLRRKAAGIGLQHLMVETDAPFLAPEPHRGKRCEPAYVVLVARKLAEIFAVPYDEVARVTTRNAVKLFRLPEVQDG